MSDEIHSVEGGCAKVQYKALGLLHNNIYCIEVGDGEVVIVDAEKSAERILAMVGDRKVVAIFVTHRHHDLREATGAAVYASAIDAPAIEETEPPLFGRQAKSCPVDVKLQDGDVIEVGKTTWKVILTPGHTEGSLCYYLEPALGTIPDGAPLLASGDTLFCGTIGRTDFPGGSIDQMAQSLKKLATLPDETIVMPGHDQMTSIAAERERTIEFYSR